MSIFSRAERATSRMVDRTYSERFTFHPMRRSPNGRPGFDPERASWTGKGILDEQPVLDPIEIGKRDRSGNDLNTLHDGAAFVFSVDLYRCRYASQAKQGDVIDLDGERRFQIVSIRPDGMSRVVWQLVKA